jgi:membrane associated rhomboid family serine protease
MNIIEITGFVLALFTIWTTYKGLNNASIQRRYKFDIDSILLDKQYERLITSGFLHVNWIHLGFNMIVLYMFAESLGYVFMGMPPVKAVIYFLIIYFGSMIGGNALALYIHRNHGDYHAVGASGAVNGLIYALIVFAPSIQIWFIPGVLFGLLYIAYSIYGIKSQADNIGHEAHLGGAMVGILLAVILQPQVLSTHAWVVAVLLLPTAIFLYLVVSRPAFLLIPTSYSFSRPRFRAPRKSKPSASSAGRKKQAVPVGKSKIIPFNPPHKKVAVTKEEELNQLLDRVKEIGFDQLSTQERQRLKELSEEID